MRTTKMRRTLVLVAMLTATLGGWAPAAHAEESWCGSHSALEVMGAGVDWWGCQMDIGCPADHAGMCTIRLFGSAYGDGLVGLVVDIDNQHVGACSFTPSTCDASGVGQLAPGAHVPVGCWLQADAAAFTRVSCTVDID